MDGTNKGSGGTLDTRNDIAEIPTRCVCRKEHENTRKRNSESGRESEGEEKMNKKNTRS